jgi:DNA (cytosine-5)-methyltransferase 1
MAVAVGRPTLTTLDRFGLVTWKGRTPMLRVLLVPELKRAMGFDNGYTLPYVSRRDRIKLLGNGVCQPVMAAVVRALTQEIGLLDAAERVASPPLATPRRHRRQLCACARRMLPRA